MKAKSNLARAIYTSRHELEWSLSELGKALALSPAGLNRLENNDRRPDVPTLRALVSHWPASKRAYGLRLLCEHLRDEVVRAGVGHGDVVIRLPSDKDLDPEVIRALDIIRSNDATYRHVCALLRQLARLPADTQLLAADGKPTWRTR